MLMDILGMVIAFSVVMLLLSLVISSLGQATQAILRLRGRNLRYGLATALAHPVDPKASTSAKPTREHKDAASEILNASAAAGLSRVSNPTSRWSRILGPRVSWIDSDDLGKSTKSVAERVYGDLATVDTEHIPQIVTRFETLDKPLRKRFQLNMRMVSLFWATLVAVLFQISTPDLIKQLSVDTEFRAQLIAAAPHVLEMAEQQLDQYQKYQALYRTALEALAQQHPQISDRIATLNEDEIYPEGLAEQLSDLIKDDDNRAKVIADLEALLVVGLTKQRDEALANTDKNIDQLSMLNIRPWREGKEFYTKSEAALQNWVGVLFTTILLTLGAPFWFNTLKTAVAWRDLLSPPGNSTEKTKGGEKS